ncbi:MAG: methionine--tRNA ligase [Methanomassiliicoccaceae archaeon]|jgi:methionyl-tRNA synthetase|nr:methionine--tRNA ligase [Methanomassiliicoccaceae archaeon]
MAKVFIGVAWPYANGTIHLGHMAGSILPPDIFSRYNRMKGNEVLMVSGSDQHGTPITVTAEKENTTPEAVAEKFHAINKKAIEDMRIEFSLFTRTHTDNHTDVVHDIFTRLLEKDMLYEKETMQYYCSKCLRFLPDRYVEGICPKCGAENTRSDQCDSCGTTFETGDLRDAVCVHCRSAPEIKGTRHFFLRLSAFRDSLLRYLEDKTYWRPNVETFTTNWLKDELKDRPITRDMRWGIPVPVDGWESKVIYVWFEAVIGYLSASKEYSAQIGMPELWKEFWCDEKVRHYYFLGKDNIPFHSIIWPSMLMGYGGLNLPYDIPANEYLMFKGGKLSKSRGGAIDIPSVIGRYDPDVLRYYLSINMPDTHDSEFTWEDFQVKVNNELVSALGNFYHRCLSFTKKNFSSIPGALNGDELRTVTDEIKRTMSEYEGYMEGCDLKKALKTVMDLSRFGNRYFDSKKPWASVKENKEQCGEAMNASLQIAKALAVMAWPFMPFSSERIWKFLGLSGTPPEHGFGACIESLPVGTELPEPVPVYAKVELPKEEAAAERPGASKAAPSGRFADMRRADIRVAEIIEADDHPDAEKLFRLKVDVGEERQIVAGLRAYYKKEDMVGRKVLLVYNLKPTKLRGLMSQGMLLAADDEALGGSTVALLRPSKDVPNGTRFTCGLEIDGREIEYKEFQKAVINVTSINEVKQKAAVITDGGERIPLSDGNGCYAVVDREIMDGANVR